MVAAWTLPVAIMIGSTAGITVIGLVMSAQRHQLRQARNLSGLCPTTQERNRYLDTRTLRPPQLPLRRQQRTTGRRVISRNG